MPILMKVMKSSEQIRGESRVAGHVDWIDLWSFQSPRSEDPYRPLKEVVATKAQDRSSPELFRCAAIGTPLTITVDFVKEGSAGGAPYLSILLENVMVSSYSTHADGQETLSLNFVKVTYTTLSAGPDISGHVPYLLDISGEDWSQSDG